MRMLKLVESDRRNYLKREMKFLFKATPNKSINTNNRRYNKTVNIVFAETKMKISEYIQLVNLSYEVLRREKP